MIQVVVPPTPPPDVPFDPNVALESIVPLIGVVAVAIACALVLRWLLRSPIGEAIAEGLRERRKRRRHWRGLGGEWIDEPTPDEGRVAALEAELGRMRGELSELAERLDFAERMLAERREPKLGAGR
jgi:hypothetical protein